MYIWNILHKLEYFFITIISYIVYILSLIPIPHLDFIQLYILVTFSLVAIFIYIKLRYPFWNVQPVYHTYDYWRRWYKTPFVIQKGIPLKTKFTDINNVLCLNLTEITNEHLSKCVDILQTSYIPSDKVLLTLNSNNLKSWLTGTNGTPMLSFYNDITYTITENKEIVPIPKHIGCMISKPIYFYYLETNNSNKLTKYKQISIYYWDYICIIKEYKEKNLSRKLIQTTEYVQRIRNPEFVVSILKKELTQCDGIIPMVKYNSNTYYLRNIQIDPLPQNFTVAQITYTQNKDILLDFLGGLLNPDIPKLFEIISVPSVTNILEMIKDFQLYCFCLKMGNNMYGIYFFKDENVLYEDIENGNTIHFIGSVNNSSSIDLFYSGFIHCIKSIIKQNRKRKKYEIIMIDETSHNKLILNRWNQKFSKIIETPSAYYLYNFFYPKMPLSAENCLILL